MGGLTAGREKEGVGVDVIAYISSHTVWLRGLGPSVWAPCQTTNKGVAQVTMTADVCTEQETQLTAV